MESLSLKKLKKNETYTLSKEKRKNIQRASYRKQIHKAILKQCMNISKSKKLFCYHPVQSEQNKNIAGNIPSTHRRTKQTTKYGGSSFLLRLCQLQLRIRSTIYGLNISSLVLYFTFNPLNYMASWFVSCETFSDSCAVHAAQRIF